MLIRGSGRLAQALGAMEFPEGIQAEIAELVKDLMREDEIGAVIRAHIRIENLLIRTIKCLLPKPVHLRKLSLDYDGRVTLALALGLKEQFGPPLRAIGKLRNDFAHKLDTKLTTQTVTNLYASLGPEDKDKVQVCFRQIKDMNEETRAIKCFADLDQGSKFKLIAVTLWAVVRAAVHLHAPEPTNGV